MAILEGLDTVPWDRLSRAYHSGADVPACLRTVAGPDEAAATNAMRRLSEVLWHQGTVYGTTAAAVPYLVELLAVTGTPIRQRLLVQLRRIATGSGYLDQHAASPFRPPHADEDLARERDDVARCRRGVVAGVPAYVSALDDPDAWVRARAAHLLAGLSERAADVLPELRRRLPTPTDRFSRVCLILALGELAAQAGQRVDELVPVLESEEPDIRAAAALALRWQPGRSGQPAAVPGVLTWALGEDLPALADAPWTEDDTYTLIADAMGDDLDENLPYVRDGLLAESPATRGSAVARASTLMYRWRHAPPVIVPMLRPLLADPAPSVRSHAASVIAHNSGSAVALAADALFAALQETVPRFPLDRRPPQKPQPYPWDPDERLVAAALEGLAVAGDLRAVGPLTMVLASNAVHVPWGAALRGLRVHAAALLPHVVSALRAPAGGPDKAELMTVLGAWGPAAADAVPALLESLPRDQALRVLVRVASRDHPDAPAILTALEAAPDQLAAAVDHWRFTGDHERALEVIRASLGDGGPWVYALDCLGRLGPAAAPALPEVRAGLARADNDETRLIIARALWRITGDHGPLLPLLLDRLQPNRVQPDDVEVLGEIGPPAAVALPFLRTVRDGPQRFAIGGFNTPVAKDEELQALAAQSVGRIERV